MIDARALLSAVIRADSMKVSAPAGRRLAATAGAGELSRVEAPASCWPGGGTLPSQIEDHFRQRIAALPEATQRLMVLAAATRLGMPPSFARPRRHSASRGRRRSRGR